MFKRHHLHSHHIHTDQRICPTFTLIRKKMWVSSYPWKKKKKSLPRWETSLLWSTLPRQPQHLHVVATAGSYEDKEPCPTQEVFSQLALFKWYRVFAFKTLKTYIWMYIYIYLRDSISLYINIFLSQACCNNLPRVLLWTHCS